MAALYLGRLRVELTVRPGVRLPAARLDLARAVARAADAAGAPMPASIGLVLTDDEELADLNAAHLGVSGPTDVLSFPMLEAGAFPPHPGRSRPRRRSGAGRPAFAPPPGRRTHLGDIAVSVERAAAQATEGRGGQLGTTRWAVADELRLLVTHGTLHLCGWDHADPVEADAMRALERRLHSDA